MNYNFWNYFCSLENDLIKLEQYVDFSKENFSVFSSEILKIFFAASSEFEVVMKEIGRKYQFKEILNVDNERLINIGTIKHLIDDTSDLLDMKNMEISFKHFEFSFIPIKELWNKKTSWWKDYNSAKHDRASNYKKVNLENLLKAIGALFIANIFLYEKILHDYRFSLENNIEITISHLKRTNLVEFKDKKYYKLLNSAYFS